MSNMDIKLPREKIAQVLKEVPYGYVVEIFYESGSHFRYLSLGNQEFMQEDGVGWAWQGWADSKHSAVEILIYEPEAVSFKLRSLAPEKST